MEADWGPGDGHRAAAEDGHGPEPDQHGGRERQVSISSTFFATFLYKNALRSLSPVTVFGFEFFWCKNIGAKIAHKM
jgi:hypothetical protein